MLTAFYPRLAPWACLTLAWMLLFVGCQHSSENETDRSEQQPEDVSVSRVDPPSATPIPMPSSYELLDLEQPIVPIQSTGMKVSATEAASTLPPWQSESLSTESQEPGLIVAVPKLLPIEPSYIPPGEIAVDPVSSPTQNPDWRPNPLRGGRLPSAAPLVRMPSKSLVHPRVAASVASPVPEVETSGSNESNELSKPSESTDNHGLEEEGPSIESVELPDQVQHTDVEAPVNAHQSDEPFDPIRVNGPIFENWPKPKLALVLTGQMNGYIEPCGCAGLDRMKGGLSRRHTMIKQLRQKGWPVVALDVGGLSKGSGPQALKKFQTIVESMRTIGYNVVGFGRNELRLSAGDLLAESAQVEGKTMFVSANVGLFGFAASMTTKTELLEVDSLKLGITSVLGNTWQKEIHNPDIEFADANKALAEIVPQLVQECDLLILLAHATKEESIALAKAFPQFDIVVTAGGPPEQPLEPETIDDRRLLIEVGEKGMNAVVLGLYDQRILRYQRVPIDSRFAQSPEMHDLMQSYQDRLRDTGLKGLGISTVPHPRRKLLGDYIGSNKCESCHEESYKTWKKTPHAKAWSKLVQADPPRNFDPECISCHVVGWNPTNHYPYQSGFLREAITPKLTNVGCESCHGPGQNHVQAEMGSDKTLQKKLQLAMTLSEEQAKTNQCITCHDGDNSPKFDFDTYWPKVLHLDDPDEEDPDEDEPS